MKFNNLFPPLNPGEPQKEIIKFKIIGSINLISDETINIEDLIKQGATHIKIGDMYDAEHIADVLFGIMETKPNLSYEKDLRRYEKYKVKLEEWQKRKIESDKKAEERKKMTKMQDYEKTKKRLKRLEKELGLDNKEKQ